MIPFITFREPNENGVLCFYILQKAFPHYCGLLISQPREGAIANMPLPEYNLWITWNGCLQGNVIPGYKGVESEIDFVFAEMADFYYKYRILENPKKYAKFKIYNDTSTK